MKKEKPPARGQVNGIKQVCFRISELLYEESRKEADAIGSSQNSFLVLMVSMGLKAYRGQYNIRRDQ